MDGPRLLFIQSSYSHNRFQLEYSRVKSLRISTGFLSSEPGFELTTIQMPQLRRCQENRMFNRLLCSAFLGFCFVTAAVGQSATSVSGTVTDPTGAVVLNSTVTLVNDGTAATRTGHTGPQGRYEFEQVPPGIYTISATAQGFGKAVVDNVELVVSTPGTVNLVFKTAGANETVEVTSSAAQVNTTDATLGTALTNRPIVQLPVEGHDVTSLLALQPGVTFISVPEPGVTNDPRSGSVNGSKSDQANVLLDGVDSNDQLKRTSFTSVLRVTPDSVQEFRTITSNPGAELGFSSGAQVTIVTKSGTNAFHGLAYEYNRNTSLEANSFLNKQTTPVTPRKALIRNVFGGTFGGPVVKDKLFFFGSYEGRRDRSANTQRRVVPNALFRAGTFSYTNTSGGTSTLTPAQVAMIDPGNGTLKGEDPAVLATLQKYPQPNSVGGDTINTEGYTFNAAAPLTYNTYFARFDYHIDRAGKHTIFWRGNYQLDNYADGAPQFDHLSDGTAEPNSSVYENFSKGYDIGYDWLATANLVNAFRFGFTRQSVATTGAQTQSAAVFDSGTITPLNAVGAASTTSAGGYATENQLPVYDIRDDVTWTKGRHTLGFGGEIFLADNHYESDANSFDSAIIDGAYLFQDGGQLLATPANSGVSAGDTAAKTLNYEVEFANLLGTETKLQRESNFDLNGNTLANGAPVKRIFSQKHFDLYLQDSWKIKSNFTFTAGIRYTMAPAIRETQGYNVASTMPLGGWFNERARLAATGQSQADAGLVTYDLSKTLGTPLYNFQRDWSPRASFAYSPKGDGGFMHALTGGAGKMSIRGGFGMYYDAFGQALAEAYASAVGFSTLTQTGPGTQIPDAPRYTGFNDIPTSSALFPAAVAGGFPQTPAPGALGEDETVDSNIRAGYTMVDNLTMERQFKGGYLLTVSYVGRQSRRSLIGEDMAEPTNLVDPTSGMSFYQAARILAGEAQANPDPNSSYVSPTVPFFENLWPGAASAGVSATQAIFKDFQNNLNDWTSASLAFDNDCIPSCSRLGPNTMWNSQFAALYSLRSVGMGSYNSAQVALHKAFSNGYEFNIDYTFSHCIDLGSSPEISGDSGAIGTIRNSWSPKQSRASCDYDLRHQFQVNGTANLPFGKGRKFGSNSNGFVNAVIGGWEITTIFRANTGFPGSVTNNVGYPTVWDTSGFATQIGSLPGKGPRGEMFSNRAAAYAAFEPTFAGQSGTRNDLRGDGLLTWDGGVDKTWQLFTVHNDPNTLQFRIEGFNLTNSARFDITTSNASLDYGTPATFGKYEGPNQLLDPRVFQAVLRYTF
jgi:hypothetical protein